MRARVTSALFGIEDGIEVGIISGLVQSCGPMILRSRRPWLVDDVGFGVHGGAVVDGDLFGGVAIVGKADLVDFEEIFVGGLVFIQADADDGTAEWGDAALEGVEGCVLPPRRAGTKWPRNSVSPHYLGGRRGAKACRRGRAEIGGQVDLECWARPGGSPGERTWTRSPVRKARTMPVLSFRFKSVSKHL